MPAGRMEAVRRELPSARLASRTISSAAACTKGRRVEDVSAQSRVPSTRGIGSLERGQIGRQEGRHGRLALLARLAHLGLGVVLSLGLAPGHRPALVGVDEVADIVAGDAGGARVDEGADAGLAAGVDDVAGAVDVDAAEELVGAGGGGLGGRRGGVDDDVRADLLEEGDDARGVGDVGLVVAHAVRVRAAVAVAAQVDDGNGGGGPVAQEHAHEVVAQEAAAARDQDSAQVRLLFGGH